MPLLGGDHTKYFVFVDGMTTVVMHERLKVMNPDEKKSDLAYEVNIVVFTIQCVQVGKSQYIVLVGNPQSKNEINNFGSDVRHVCDSASSS